MDDSLKEAKNKYGLRLLNSSSNYSYSYSNLKCVVTFWVSDIQSFKWNFYNPVSQNDFLYEPSYYMEFILNIKRPKMVFDNSIKNIKGLIKGTFDNFNRELIDYMEAPMTGDFSWHNLYLKKLKQRKKYVEFSCSTNASHSVERRNVARMYRRKENGWEEAIQSYFAKYYPDGGKEFEVDDIFKK